MLQHVVNYIHFGFDFYSKWGKSYMIPLQVPYWNWCMSHLKNMEVDADSMEQAIRKLTKKYVKENLVA